MNKLIHYPIENPCFKRKGLGRNLSQEPATSFVTQSFKSSSIVENLKGSKTLAS